MVKPRRQYSAAFKVRVVLEMISGEKGLMQTSREYGIKDTVLLRWKQEFLKRAPQVFEAPRTADEQGERMAELERMVGRLTIGICHRAARSEFNPFHFISCAAQEKTCQAGTV